MCRIPNEAESPYSHLFSQSLVILEIIDSVDFILVGCRMTGHPLFQVLSQGSFNFFSRFVDTNGISTALQTIGINSGYNTPLIWMYRPISIHPA